MRSLHSDFWLNITKAVLTTPDLEQLLYIVLSASTAGDGLQFNRAFLFLTDEEGRKLTGSLAIGPSSQEEAFRIWEAMTSQRFDLPLLLARFATFHNDPQASALTSLIRQLAFSLPLTGHSPFEHLMSRAIRQQSVVSNDTPIPLMHTEIALYDVGMVSLVAGEKTMGVLIVDNAFNRRRISTQELNLLATIGNLVTLGIERFRLHNRIRTLAETDSLTGLMQRHIFNQKAPTRFDQAVSSKDSLSLLMLDIDHFRKCNETHGHWAGDDILRHLGRLLRTELPTSAISARLGGDDFIALLPHHTQEQATLCAEHIQQRWHTLRFGYGGEIQTTLTIAVNANISSYPSFHQMFLHTVEHLDSSQTNQSGNIVVVSPPTSMQPAA